MYRTNDPRFRRRLNEIGQTLESANETAQSGIYIFAQTYIKPCIDSVGNCLTSCVDAGCPSLNLSNRDRLRRQRGRARSRGRAEVNFDFYDDWDEDETDGLLGWGNDEFDRLLAGSGGYGTVANTQPARQRGMSYPKGRRKSAHDAGPDATVIASPSLLGKLFGGGKHLRYKPSAADLQEHPGARRLGRDLTEGEALLEDSEPSDVGEQIRRPGRNRSDTDGSRETHDSYSSRGDIFPSDEEDAVPLDDEFAMVLERRTTHSGDASGGETEVSSNRTADRERTRGKRLASSRKSSRRTVSSKSTRSKRLSRTSSTSAIATGGEDFAPQDDADAQEIPISTLNELKQEDATLAAAEEAELESRRQEAHRLAAERGLLLPESDKEEAGGERTVRRNEQSDPLQLPTPVPTDDEEDHSQIKQQPGEEPKEDTLP